ncbi:MAG: hypothetical protein RLZZ626_95 [Actinomycetota bacterium]
MAKPLSSTVDKGVANSGALVSAFARQIVPIAPILVLIVVFLIWPIVNVAAKAFEDNNGNFTLDNFVVASQGVYAQAFGNSISLGIYSALLASIPGAAFAYIIESRGSEFLKRIINSATSVLAISGGVPLAFMFIAAFGVEGSATVLLKFIGLDLYASGFTLFSYWGLVLVYCFFQIPIMVLVFSPAVQALRKEWTEAARSLGASKWQYWRHVGIPLLFPSFSASFLLLFASAFSAYATARAMTVGTIALVPLMIGTLVDGNVIVDQFNLGKALAIGMVLVTAVAMVPYLLIQRRVARWQK